MQLAGAALVSLLVSQATGGIAGSRDLALQAHSGCTSQVDRDAMRSAYLAHAAQAPEGVNPVRFQHYPMAGVLGEDASTGYWMDLDPAGNALLDWNCTERTYDGHQGIDTGFKSWGEQLIGVPVFAAGDGTVFFAQDGWPDMNTQGGVQGNIVGIDHGGGVLSSYWHLKLGSVAVSVGQVVKAGHQVAMAASSGNSFGPHLHLGMEHGSQNVVDPNDGPCNDVDSHWVHQPEIDYDFHLFDAGVSRIDLNGYYPPDVMPATNQMLLGDGPIRFWNWMVNLPPSSTWRVVFVRPNGSTAFDSFTVPFGNATTYENWWTWWEYDVGEMHTLAGTWTVDFFINGALQWSAPVEVVSSLNPSLNHAPEAITVAFEPSLPTQLEPVRARALGPLIQADKDWDKLSYRYVWKANGVTVRDATSAMRTDTLAHSLALTGQTLTCTVTPNDGHVNGASAMASVVIQSACPAPTSYCTATTNSAGTHATLSAAGTTSISHDDFTLLVSGSVPGKLGIFFYGAGTTQAPFGNGWRCVTLPVQRIDPPISADANGYVERRMSMTSAPLGSGPNALQPGQTRYFQWWHRDPAAGGANVNLSTGLSATFCP